MKPEEVNAMTNEQLRVKTAKLLGAVKFEWRPNDIARIELWQFVTQGSTERYLTGGWSRVPDYLNDMSAAWLLWTRLEADGFIVTMENGTKGRGRPIISVRGTGKYRLFDCIFRGKEGKIIMKAFILAMTADEEG